MRSILSFFAVVCLLVGTALPSTFASPVDMIDVYTPSDPEVSALLSSQTYLKQYNEDTGKVADQSQFGSLVDLSQKYAILQTYLFEAFIQTTPNRSVTAFYRQYAQNHWPQSQNMAVTASLVDRPAAPKPGPGQTPTYTLPDGKSAEWINLFGLDEIAVFDGRLHATIFQDNLWSQLNIGDKAVGFICGGGTNSASLIFKRVPGSQSDFVSKTVFGDFDTNKYENWKVKKLAATGVLARAGADAIYLGQGATLSDGAYEAGSVALYLYSQKYSEGYELVAFMNFARPNVHFDEAARMWHYLAEVLLLSWVD